MEPNNRQSLAPRPSLQLSIMVSFDYINDMSNLFYPQVNPRYMTRPPVCLWTNSPWTFRPVRLAIYRPQFPDTPRRTTETTYNGNLLLRVALLRLAYHIYRLPNCFCPSHSAMTNLRPLATWLEPSCSTVHRPLILLWSCQSPFAPALHIISPFAV